METSETNAQRSELARCRAALVLAGVLWSAGGVFIKVLTAHPEWPASALAITGYRSFFAALVLAPLLRGLTLPKPGDLLVSVGLYTGLLALYVAATQGTTAANAIFLQYTAPLYALALGPLFFGEPFRRADAAALAVAMGGIAVLFFGNFSGGERGPLLMGLGSGFGFGIFLLWLRRMRYAHPMAVTALNNAGVAALAALAMAFFRPADLALLPAAATRPELLPVVGLLAAMGALQIAAPYVLFSYGLRRIPGVEASLLTLIEPVLNPLWVALVVRERPTPATLLGGALIIAALAARYTLFRPRGTEAAASA